MEKLSLISHYDEEDKYGFVLPGDDHEVPIEEALGGFDHDEKNNNSRCRELLHEAFKNFDEDGNGFIDALEREFYNV